MDRQILELYKNSNQLDKELIIKLLFINPTLTYKDLEIFTKKFNNLEDETIMGDLLALVPDNEKEFIYKIVSQIPDINKGILLDLIIGMRRIDEGMNVEDYIREEYNNIMYKWHKEYPQFDLPNGVISLSVNGEDKFVKVGDNPSIDENSLYDIASMTKLYTEVILFRIIKENKYGINLDTKLKDIKLASGKEVKELYPKLDLNMTFRELISFNNIYKTDEDKPRITEVTNRNDALNTLRTSRIDEENRGHYKYTDLPIMILTDLLEEATGKNYSKLLENYIIKPLNLHNTSYINLDEKNRERYTGINKNGVNDPKSNIIGGGGHAGVITDANDLMKFLKNIFEPGFIFDSNMDPMLFDMLGMTKTTNKNYTIGGKRIEPIIEPIKKELQSLGVSEGTINKTISEITKQRETGVSVIGNLNVAAEGFKINDYTYDSLASQTLLYKGFMVQGSTRVQGDIADFVLDGEMYRTASSILIDIHNQYDNIKSVDTKGNATKEYYVQGKGMMKMADARKSGLGYFGGYYDKLSNMLSIARLMEIYEQSKKLQKGQSR